MPSAFPSDDRCLGGADLIMRQYVHAVNSKEDARPTRAILEANKTVWQTPAQTLSTNRAAKRAAINNEMTEHARNVYHLNRRIENAYSVTERRKNPYDPIMFPAHQKRSTNFYRNSLHNSMMAWIPGTGRPKSAPTVKRQPRVHGDSYSGWSVTKNLRNVFYADDFPLEPFYRETQKEDTYLAYKRAMMQEILESRMYKEQDLRQLFRSYQKLAPLRDKEAVDRVVRELKLELDVRYPNRVEVYGA